jgi:HD-GYP domain-containing protein (c-di-GMP phosphodiesterase class II)
MVRLIKIIKKSLAAEREARSELESGAAEDLRLKPADARLGQRQVPGAPETLPAENPYRRKGGPAGSGQGPVLSEELKVVYRDLHAAVQFSLTNGIHADAVDAVLGRVVSAFEADPYNELLLLSYAVSHKKYLPAHIANDVILTVGFARSLGLSSPDLHAIAQCAFVHDLGMGGVEEISRKGQQLNDGEIEDIKQHPVRSSEIARAAFSQLAASVVLDVHERENGQGYPRGIPGARIHLWAKLIAICDAFEALTHPRVFRPSYSPYEAMKIIIRKKDVLFEDAVVKRFIEYLSIYPVGSLVYLNSGETAMVVGANVHSPTRPVVRVLVNENREVEEGEKTIDLAEKDFVYVGGVLEPEKEKEILYFLKPRGQVDIDQA